MNIQWYPGHMTKAKRMMQEDIKLIDIVVEILDARVPLSSKNPDIDKLAVNKKRLILLNKFDLADERVTAEWIQYFQSKGFAVAKINAKQGIGMKAISSLINEACKEKIERDRKRGILNRPIRAMIVGIPNVGKSTFINAYAGKACTKVGNKPGVTKGKQWIRIQKNVELLDTPGILWPKFEDQEVGIHLAFIGSIKDDILNTQELSLLLISFLQKSYPELLSNRYSLVITGEEKPVDILLQIAQNRQCRLKGDEWDYEKAAMLLLDDYRSGKLGHISLECPVEDKK